MTFIKKHLGVCVLFLLFTLGATKAQAQFVTTDFTNEAIPQGLFAEFTHNNSGYTIGQGYTDHWYFSDCPSSIDINFSNYSEVGGYINIKVYDYNDEIIYDETQYIGAYDFTYQSAAGATFNSVPTDRIIVITTSSTN